MKRAFLLCMMLAAAPLPAFVQELLRARELELSLDEVRARADLAPR